jgi:hypothetical protein
MRVKFFGFSQEKMKEETMKKLKTMKGLSSRERSQGSRQAEGRVLFYCARKTLQCANSETIATVLPRLSRRCRASTAHGDADSKESRGRLSRSFVGPWMGGPSVRV